MQAEPVDFEAIKERQRMGWEAGDYPRVGNTPATLSEPSPPPGRRTRRFRTSGRQPSSRRRCTRPASLSGTGCPCEDR